MFPVRPLLFGSLFAMSAATQSVTATNLGGGCGATQGYPTLGAGDGRIIFRHILPNVMSHVIVGVTLAIPTIVLLESFLGFLGFAVKPPLISWGLMLQDTSAFSVIGSYPWILSPVVFVLITVFAFNALGDGLRDAIDPY